MNEYALYQENLHQHLFILEPERPEYIASKWDNRITGYFYAPEGGLISTDGYRFA